MSSAGYHRCTKPNSIYSCYHMIMLSQVWKTCFWMQLHGGPTPKRTVCFSNGSWIGGLDLGKLTKRVRQRETQFKTSRRGLTVTGFMHMYVCWIPSMSPGIHNLRSVDCFGWNQKVPMQQEGQGNTVAASSGQSAHRRPCHVPCGCVYPIVI